MPNLKKILAAKLKGAKKIAVLGIGSELRGDDVAGELVAKGLSSSSKKIRSQVRLRFFLGSTAPENLTGEIKKFQPSHIIIIDSADLGKKPGTIRLLSPKQIGGVSFSTHRIPTKVMVDYLLSSLGSKIIIIGIQPKTLLFGLPLSGEVERSVKLLSLALRHAFPAD
jgi:hydrogenase 3 maturation protease